MSIKNPLAAKSEGSIFVSALSWLTLIFFLAPFIYAYGFCYPRGDDFDEATRAMFLFDFPGGLYEAAREWLTWSGRYCFHFMAVLLAKTVENRFYYGLACLSVALLFAWAVYLIASNLFEKKNAVSGKIYFSLLALLCLYAGHKGLANFYLYIDALTSGLQVVLCLLFLAFLFRLYQEIHNAEACRKTWLQCLCCGICAIGVYETCALAVFLSAMAVCIMLNLQNCAKPRDIFDNFRFNPKTKPFFQLLIWLFCCLCVSFFAPGNFMRASIRHVDASRKLEQLSHVFLDWLDCQWSFLTSVWPWLGFCVAFYCLLCAKPGPSKKALPIAFTALLTYLGVSLAIGCLLALSDTPLKNDPKQTWNICALAAIAWTIALYNLLRCFKLRHCVSKYPAIFKLGTLILFFCGVGFSANFQITATNAANGEFLRLAEFMTIRKKELALAEKKFTGREAWPKMGLIGEIYDKNARKPHLKPYLAQIQLDAMQKAVYPVYLHEAHPESPTAWPNLWSAWFYGVGSLGASLSDAKHAIGAMRQGKALDLGLGLAIRQMGIKKASLVKAPGNLTQPFWWVLMEGDLKPDLQFYVPAPVSWLRLEPLPLQNLLLARLLGQRILKPDIWTRLAGSITRFNSAKYRKDAIYAFPLLIYSELQPLVMFLSSDGENFYRLEPVL